MGLIGGMARTAVIAGTATAVGNRVSRRQANRWSKQDQSAYADDPYAQPQYAQPQYAQPQYAPPQYAQPQYVPQPQYAQPQYVQPQPVAPAPPPAPAAPVPDKYEQLRKLGEFHEQGILTDQEFADQKARILAT
jgi:hypothetical protein